MCKRYGILLLCVLLLCAFSAVVEGESGVGSLMSSIDNYPEDTAESPAKQPEQQDAPQQEAAEAFRAGGDVRVENDSKAENTVAKRNATQDKTDLETAEVMDLESVQVINQIEEPGQIIEALAGSGARTIAVTYVAADEAIGRLDVFAECQTPGVTETWYSEVANLEVGQTGVFELPSDGTGEYRVCIVCNDGSGFVVLSISTK